MKKEEDKATTLINFEQYNDEYGSYNNSNQYLSNKDNINNPNMNASLQNFSIGNSVSPNIKSVNIYTTTRSGDITSRTNGTFAQIENFNFKVGKIIKGLNDLKTNLEDDCTDIINSIQAILNN